MHFQVTYFQGVTYFGEFAEVYKSSSTHSQTHPHHVCFFFNQNVLLTETWISPFYHKLHATNKINLEYHQHSFVLFLPISGQINACGGRKTEIKHVGLNVFYLISVPVAPNDCCLAEYLRMYFCYMANLLPVIEHSVVHGDSCELTASGYSSCLQVWVHSCSVVFCSIFPSPSRCTFNWAWYLFSSFRAFSSFRFLIQVPPGIIG